MHYGKFPKEKGQGQENKKTKIKNTDKTKKKLFNLSFFGLATDEEAFYKGNDYEILCTPSTGVQRSKVIDIIFVLKLIFVY